MLVSGEVKCLHCGHTRGEWIGTRGAPLTNAGLKAPSRPSGDPAAAIRCSRCDGPVYLEDVTPVSSARRLRRIRRLRAQLADLDGRRPNAA